MVGVVRGDVDLSGDWRFGLWGERVHGGGGTSGDLAGAGCHSDETGVTLTSSTGHVSRRGTIYDTILKFLCPYLCYPGDGTLRGRESVVPSS